MTGAFLRRTALAIGFFGLAVKDGEPRFFAGDFRLAIAIVSPLIRTNASILDAGSHRKVPAACHGRLKRRRMAVRVIVSVTRVLSSDRLQALPALTKGKKC
jgi:hypothetical protein